MPNHVNNIIKVENIDDFNKIREFMKSKTSEFDFNNLIPMPENLWCGSVTYRKEGSPSPSNWRILSEEDVSELDLGKLFQKDFKPYGNEEVESPERRLFGKDTASDWCPKNWGTKWNAYNIHFKEESLEIFFHTAWDGVPKLVALLSQNLNVPIEYRYYDILWGEDPMGYLKTISLTLLGSTQISIDELSIPN